MAYNAVVNPLFVQLPNVAELMPTATNFKSAYGRAQLALVPPRPVNAINIIIPDQYKTIALVGNVAPAPFLMFNTSFPSAPGGPIDSTILAFGTDDVFRNLCNARTVYMDGTFSICPPQFYQSSIHYCI